MSTGSSNTRSSRCALAAIAAAASSPSSSTRDVPTSRPSALKKAKHIAPPTRTASAVSSILSMTPILSETLAPPSTTTNGRWGSVSSLPSISSSRVSNSPATAGSRWATPSVEACARWAAPKASLT